MARTRSEDITSFKEHRANLRSHFDRARETGRPLFVTSRGQPDAVVLSPEAYDELAERAAYLDSLLALEAGMADVKAGRTQPVDDALRAIATELGLDLDR